MTAEDSALGVTLCNAGTGDGSPPNTCDDEDACITSHTTEARWMLSTSADPWDQEEVDNDTCW